MDMGKLSKLSECRRCRECGKEFKSDEVGSALQKFAEHLISHQPSPEQWGIAYSRIQGQRMKRPKRETDSLRSSWRGMNVRTVS